jgi:MFS transporter, NNP family, nitrate/nitrite transporter
MHEQRDALPVGAILLFMLCFYLSILSRAMFSPLLLSIEEDLGISHAAGGSLFFLMSIGYAPVVFFSGFMASRVKHRGSILLSMLCLSLTLLLLSQSRSLAMVRFGSLLMGMASGLYTASGIATVIHITPLRHRGKAIALHEIAPNLASLSAPLIALALVPFFPWRGILLFIAVATLAAGFVFWRFDRGSHFRGVPPNLSALRVYLVDRDFWLLTLFFVVNACAALGIYSLLPTYLIDERGMDSITANLLVSISRVGSIAIIFLSGWLVDRFGVIKLIAASILLTALPTILLGAGSGLFLTVAVLLQPMIAVVFFTPALVALSKIGPPESRNVAVSITTPLAVLLGGGVYPYILGVLGEMGQFYIGFIVLGVLMLVCLPLLRFLRL